MPRKRERLTSFAELGEKFKKSESKPPWTKKGDVVIMIDGRDDRMCHHGRVGIVLRVDGEKATIGFFDGKRRAREHECANLPGALVHLTLTSWLPWRYRNMHMLD